MSIFLSSFRHFLIVLKVCLLQATIKLDDERSSFCLDGLSWLHIKNAFPALRDGQAMLVLLQIIMRPLWIVTLLCLNILATFPWITVSWFSSLFIIITLNLMTERLKIRIVRKSFFGIFCCPQFGSGGGEGNLDGR